ncbi:putative transcription factor At5g28040 [Bidens hawaiensis]|uniref:putative transcription factor At5g28040 n=1 Tax=Bidens hawaiensis TaxID=980011 RepID=UPI00404AAA05
MASQQDNDHDHDHLTTLYPDEEEDDDTEEDEDQTLPNHPVDQDDVDDDTSSGAGEVTIAVAGVPVTTTTPPPITSNIIIPDQKKTTPLDDSRRLFQRLWTDEDEIELLQGFLDYNNQRLAINPFHHHHHHDTTAFYDQIKDKLQLEFNRNQLVEKLRRLKKKYRNVLSKISSGKEYVFKTAHDQITFDLSSKIWTNETPASGQASTPARFDDEDINNPSPNPNLNVGFNLNDQNGHGVAVGYVNNSENKVLGSRKRSRSGGVKIEEKVNPQHFSPPAASVMPNSVPAPGQIPNLVEETVKSCLLPLFKELLEGSVNGAGRGFRGFGLGGMGLDPFSGLGGLMSLPFGDVTDEKWRKQRVLELEVFSKRLELVQEQINLQLEELKPTRR